MNDMINLIMNRRSVRNYNSQPISEKDLHTILDAAMSGPTCANTRDWSFIVVTDKTLMDKMADANGHPAEPLRRAPLGILICGDLQRAFPRAKDYWVIDGAIAGQNMILAAEALGIGSVWLGTWPQMERVNGLSKLFNLPETIIPHSIIAFGYSAEEKRMHPAFEPDRVHYEKW